MLLAAPGVNATVCTYAQTGATERGAWVDATHDSAAAAAAAGPRSSGGGGDVFDGCDGADVLMVGRRTGAKAEAWCLRIHADSSLYLGQCKLTPD